MFSVAICSASSAGARVVIFSINASQCSNCCRQMFQFNDEDDIASILGDDDGRNSDPNS